MIDVATVISYGLKHLKVNLMEDDIKIENPEEITHSLLHDLKNMVIDIQNIKAQVASMSTEERLNMLEERMNILLLENAKLKLILEDVCHEAGMSNRHKPKTRRKS